MPKKDSRQPLILRLARIHFVYVLAFAAMIIVADSWALIAPESTLRRWTMAAIMLVTTTAVWYAARQKPRAWQARLPYALIILDIAVATFMVYEERGMASRGVALYAIPLVVAALTGSRSTVLATASLSTAAYGMAAIRYFVTYFNEGYKVELYATIGFYSVMFFVLAALLTSRQDRKT